MIFRVTLFIFALLLSYSTATAQPVVNLSETELSVATHLQATRTVRELAPLAQKLEQLAAPLLGQKKLDPAAAKAFDEASDDPVTLRAVAATLRDSKPELAKFLFDRALSKEEINHYERFSGTTYARALRSEFLGDLDAARAAWKEVAATDPLTTYILLSRFSRDPDRATLLNGIHAQVVGLADAAKRGEPAAIYTTRKGTERQLTAMTAVDALAKLEAGESLSYVTIDELDLTGKTFSQPVGCSRCVVGTIKGWNSKFSRFSYRGFVLGDMRLGKAWTGEVNRSRSLPPATFDELILDKAVIFGDLAMDSVHVSGGSGFPFVVVNGKADLRNTQFDGDLDMRYAAVRGALVLEGAQFNGPTYFGHLNAGGLDLTRTAASDHALLFDSTIFTGPVTAARCKLDRGATFENALFVGDVDFHHCEVGARLNMSRARFLSDARLAYMEVDNIDMFGAHAVGRFELVDSVVHGNARFALDGLNRRLNLKTPHPLHTLYKQYQGDVDANALLSERSQYGVVHVDDLAVQFGSDTSFANTYFEKFVGFEGVTFGTAGTRSTANFFNTQLYGEAHFENTTFHSIADFRTISGNEISFNGARIDDTWMLDDANVPGRLSMSEVVFADTATLSFRGARLAYFGITMSDIAAKNGSRLFYERCTHNGVQDLTDPRLLAARWNPKTEKDRPEADAKQRAEKLCLDYTIGEFVVLRDSFNTRGMTDESDTAYWNLRHYTNLRYRTYATTALDSATAWLQWAFFEKAFGWGVHLSNLFWSSLFVILVFMVLFRTWCGDMLVDWDDRTMPLKDLPSYALFIISLHSFLGRARDWKSKSSNRTWKMLYTTEMIIGIILITFFIGAYARIILR